MILSLWSDMQEKCRMTKLGIKIINSVARELYINHDRLLKYIKIQEVCQELFEPLRDEWEASDRYCSRQPERILCFIFHANKWMVKPQRVRNGKFSCEMN